MTYYRDYVAERLEIVKEVMGESYSKFDENEILNSIRLGLPKETLDCLNVPLVTNKTDKAGSCKASLKNIHVGVFEFEEIPWIRAMIDSWIIQDEYSIDECIDELRAMYVNENISNGMKKGKFLSDFEELQLRAEELGYEVSLKR